MTKKNKLKMYLIMSIISIILILSLGCDSKSSPTAPVIHTRGEIEQLNNTISMTAENIEQLLTDINLTVPFNLTHSIQTVSVEYYTIDADGNVVIASGAIIVPQGINDLPLVSIQHGTETKSDRVASVSPVNSVEGTVGLIMASMGYLVVVPDYLGFGVSDVMHPYMHAESLVPSVIDLMRVGKTYSVDNSISLDGRVFLTGYSEGGFATLLTQKDIEENYSLEFNLTAVAPLSGPYDLTGMMETIFQSDSYSTPAYLGFFFTAYNEIYDWNRLNEIFNEPYASQMPGLFDGTKTWGEIVNQLPATFTELMDPAFVQGYANGDEQEFISAVESNTMLDWFPQAPIHFFHGEADQIVPIVNAYTAIAGFTAAGATDIQLTVIPGGTHESSGPEAIIGTIEWFEEF